MKKILSLVVLILLSGCMSIIRLCPREYSCELRRIPGTDEWVKTNIVYGPVFYPMCLYPSVHVRYDLIAFSWRSAPAGYHWRHYMGPIAGIVSCIGLPGDLLVDTCCLPWDIDAIKDASPCAMCRDVDASE